MTTVYVPGTEEQDPKKIIMSLQQIGPRLATAEDNITALEGDYASLTEDNTLAGQQTISNTTDATSSSDGGAATIAGGLAVAKKTYLGGLLTVNGQVAFPATANPSSDANTLDDYEEGTFTPVLTFATPGDLSVAYSTQVGSYTKIGRLVFVQLLVLTSTFTHTTAAGNLQITGLPFTSSSSPTGLIWRGLCRWGGITLGAGYTQVLSSLVGGGTTITLATCGSGVAAGAVTTAEMPTGGTVNLSVALNYHV